MYQKLENLSLWVIKIGVVLCLFVPLIIYVGVPYPNIFPKTIFFRTVVEVLFVFYIFLILFKPKTYLPKFSFLSLSVLVFISVLTVSSILGINPYRSFWGTLVRGEGLITYFHLLWFFIIVMGVFDNKKSHSCGYKSLSDLNGFFSSRNSLFSNFKSFISQVPLRLTKLRKKID